VQRQPTASVVACTEESVAAQVQGWIRTASFRPYTNTDVVGVELGGVVKNVIALATGMAEGMGFGDNSKAAIMTRGLAEMTRLGVALGAGSPVLAARARSLLARLGLPVDYERRFDAQAQAGITVDKKRRGSTIRFVLVPAPGETRPPDPGGFVLAPPAGAPPAGAAVPPDPGWAAPPAAGTWMPALPPSAPVNWPAPPPSSEPHATASDARIAREDARIRVPRTPAGIPQ